MNWEDLKDYKCTITHTKANEDETHTITMSCVSEVSDSVDVVSVVPSESITENTVNTDLVEPSTSVVPLASLASTASSNNKSKVQAANLSNNQYGTIASNKDNEPRAANDAQYNDWAQSCKNNWGYVRGHNEKQCVMPKLECNTGNKTTHNYQKWCTTKFEETDEMTKDIFTKQCKTNKGQMKEMNGGMFCMMKPTKMNQCAIGTEQRTKCVEAMPSFTDVTEEVANVNISEVADVAVAVVENAIEDTVEDTVEDSVAVHAAPDPAAAAVEVPAAVAVEDTVVEDAVVENAVTVPEVAVPTDVAETKDQVNTTPESKE